MDNLNFDQIVDNEINELYDDVYDNESYINEEPVIFARKENGCYRLFHATGEKVTILPHNNCWPMLWPMNSELSAFYDHCEGIVLDQFEFDKIASFVDVE